MTPKQKEKLKMLLKKMRVRKADYKVFEKELSLTRKIYMIADREARTAWHNWVVAKQTFECFKDECANGK